MNKYLTTVAVLILSLMVIVWGISVIDDFRDTVESHKRANELVNI